MSIATDIELTRSQAKRAQRKRQRERVQNELRRAQRDLTRRTGERSRARQDRDRLAEWIEATLPGARVDRSKSGQWRVVAR